MRKHPINSNIRKKAAAAADRRPEFIADSFHNGQTPSCRLLYSAILDVFPELQQPQQEQQSTPSSNLGNLLRWQFLENRKARRIPAFPSLNQTRDATSQQNKNEQNETQDNKTFSRTSSSTTTSKKKRKKKKKKKNQGDTAMGSNNGSQGAADGSSSKMAVAEDDESSFQDYNDEEDFIPLKASDHQPKKKESDLDRSTHSIQSIEELDRSVDEMAELMSKHQAAPALDLLPADDLVGDRKTRSDTLESSASFFEQIQPSHENTEPVPKHLALSSSSIPQPPPSSPPPATKSSSSPRTKDSSPSTPLKESKCAGTSYETPQKSIQLSSLSSSIVKSPTHEWVPAEGAKSLEEVPPGDVIKNPLELPYLLTLKSDQGLTTTTIDGSLISAVSPANNNQPTNNVLETTKVLLEEWLDQLPADDGVGKKSRKQEMEAFILFLQGRLHGPSGIGIEINELREACNLISCMTCKRDALAEVEKLTNHDMVVLNPSCLKDDNSQYNLEQAFDYFALEEGHHTPTHLRQQEEPPDLNTCLSFDLVEAKQKKNTPKQLQFQSFTKKHLESLTEDWLPSGIEEDILVTTVVKGDSDHNGVNNSSSSQQVLSDEEFRDIVQKVLTDEQGISAGLNNLQSIGEDLQREMSQISHTSPHIVPNLEFKAFPIMKNCDKLCFSYIAQIVDILKAVGSEECDAFADLQLRLWVSFLGSLSKTLKACDIYYNKVAEEMADQSGIVPKMFVSAPLRTLFQELVQDKVDIWSTFGNNFSNQLQPRALREFCTHSQWQMARGDRRQENASLLLDDKCNDLVRDLLDWTETILGGRIGEIQKQRMAQTETLLENLQSVIEPLSMEYATMEKYFSANRNRYFASLRSNIILAQGVKKRMRLIDNNEVECMATGVVLMWRHVRIMQHRMINECPPLPLQLKRFMLQTDQHYSFEDWHIGRNSSHFTSANTRHELYCRPGNGGKRRVMCVLAGLVHQWLHERCEEWKAEMAEKELMADFDLAAETVGTVPTSSSHNNGANGSMGKASKSSKRNKKKKKASTSLVNESGTENNNAPDLDTHNNPTAPNGNGALKEGSTQKSVRLEGANNDKSSTTMTTDEVLIITAGSKDECAAPEENTVPPEESNDEGEPTASDDEDIDSYPSLVYVQDGSEITSARDFLAARLHALLEEVDGEKVILIK